MTKRMLALITAVVALLAFGSVALADVEEGTFDDDGFVSGDGRFVTTQVSIECDLEERYRVRLTVTQDDTGAYSEVKKSGECTGNEEDLVLSGPARGKALFDVSEETEACALVRTRIKGDVTDAEQFCEDDINLDETDD
jgi:hypothetical protein